MMRTSRMLFAGLLMPVALAHAGDLTVALLEISEHRYKSLRAEEKSQRFTGRTSQLSLHFEFAGSDAETFTHWGRFEVKTAKLAPEGELKPRADAYRVGGDGFVEINRQQMFFGREAEGKNRLELKFDYSVPPRRAQRIARLEAEVTLRRSEQQRVVVEKLAEKLGRPVDEPALKKVGVEAEIRQPAGDSPNLEVVIRGNHARVLDLDVLDAEGQSLTSGSWSIRLDDVRTVQLMLDSPVPADAKLRLVVATKFEDIRVPIRIEDVELP